MKGKARIIAGASAVKDLFHLRLQGFALRHGGESFAFMKSEFGGVIGAVRECEYRVMVDPYSAPWPRSSISRQRGQGQHKNCAGCAVLPGLALHLAAMALGDGAHQGQAQANAA